MKPSTRLTLRIDHLLERMDARPSCLECVYKHIGSAMVLMSEVERGYPEHKLLAIGHLSEAEEESQDQYPELASALREIRKEYQSEGETPDLYGLVELMRAIGAWDDGEPIDWDDEDEDESPMMRYQYRPDSFIRFDAMAGGKKCTPGQTIACGDVCRTPKNCEQNKPSAPSAENRSRKSLEGRAEALVTRIGIELTTEQNGSPYPASFAKEKRDELNASAVAAFNRYGKNGAKVHLLKQAVNAGFVADPTDDGFDQDDGAALHRDLFITALNKLDPSGIQSKIIREPDRLRIEAARRKRGAKEVDPLKSVDPKKAIASYMETLVSEFENQDWEELNTEIAEARKRSGNQYGKEFIKQRLELSKSPVDSMVAIVIDQMPDEDINTLVKAQKRAFVGRPGTRKQRLMPRKDSLLFRLDSLAERYDRQTCKAGVSQPCGDVCIPMRRNGKPLKCADAQKGLGFKAKSKLEGLRSRFSGKERKLAQQAQSTRFQKKQLQARAAWEARKQTGQRTTEQQEQRKAPTKTPQRPNTREYKAPKRDPWEGQDYSSRKGTNPNYNESADLELLGLKDVDARSLSKAYKALARKHHPDLGGSKEKMQRVNQAYENLKKKYGFDSRLDSAIGVEAGSYWVRMDAWY